MKQFIQGVKWCRRFNFEILYTNFILKYIDSGEENLMEPWGGKKKHLTYQTQLTEE
jgi:hypothetical protein